MPRYAALFFAFIALLLPVTCAQSPAAEPKVNDRPTRREMIRSAVRAPTRRFVYCLEPDQDAGQLQTFLQSIADKRPFGKSIEVVNCHEVPDEELRNGSYFVFGNILPVRTPTYGDSGYNLIPNHERAADEVLFLPYFANPWSDSAAVTAFYLADDPQQLMEVLTAETGGNWDRLFWANWAYELHAANGDRIYGSFDDQGAGWAFDERKEFVMQSPDVPVYDRDGLQLFAYDGATSQAHIDKVVSTLRRVNEIITKDDTGQVVQQQPTASDVPPLRKRRVGEADNYPQIRLYPNLERIALRRNDMNPVQYDPEEHVLHIVPGFVTREELLLDVEMWSSLSNDTIIRKFGMSKQIAQLQHTTPALSATDTYGQRLAEALRLEATGVLDRPTQDRPSRLIEEARIRMAVVRNSGHAAPPDRTSAPTHPLAGMTFAHEGYRGHNGYGGEKIGPSLDSLAELHVNALAIVPYTSMRNPNRPTALHLPARGGTENDYATANAVRNARARNWFTLLKPQIWVGGGHWPGDVNFTTAEDWDAFFNNYTYWILHYAVLAQREGVDALCLGTELVHTTGRYPDRWREIIRKVRLVYGGQLTYAANWGEEFDNFTFWGNLDAIGLNAYYPIAEGADPADEKLLAGSRRWLRMAAKVSREVDRPLWLTEVGYRSVKAAWQHPHAEAGDRSVSVVDQARCYDALWTAAAETPELRGAFIWKWPSYLGRNGNRRAPNRGFTPGGKPAADRTADFYRSWR